MKKNYSKATCENCGTQIDLSVVKQMCQKENQTTVTCPNCNNKSMINVDIEGTNGVGAIQAGRIGTLTQNFG